MSSLSFPKQHGRIADFTDLPTGGAIPVTIGTSIEQFRQIKLTQTTAGQVATLPTPSDTDVAFRLAVTNDGSAAVTMYGVTLTPDSASDFYWDGTQWLASVMTTVTPEIIEMLTPTALNTVPDLAGPVAPGTVARVFINGVFAPVGVTVSAAGVITVAPGALTYNVATTDMLTVFYTPA